MRLVADHAGRAIGRRRVDAACIHVRLGTRDEEGAGLMQRVQPREVDVAAIHDVEGTGLGKQQIEHVDVVQLAVGDVDEASGCCPAGPAACAA